jgi:hypothetical protein
MTKYYIGYLQGNNEYVYVSNITPTNVGLNVIVENALSFSDKDLASGVLDYVKTIVVNQDFKVLEITTNIKEVK